jgi:hypothetical protein
MISGFDDFAAAQAGSANADALVAALHFSVDRAQIDVPTPLGHVMGVADIVPKLRPFAADFAYLCHDCSEVGSNAVSFYFRLFCRNWRGP